MHVDVYEGPAQSLVTPDLRSLLGNSNRPVTAIDPGYYRSVNAFDVGEQYSMYGWAFPVPPGSQGVPARLYAVGTVCLSEGSCEIARSAETGPSTARSRAMNRSSIIASTSEVVPTLR